LRRPTQFFEYRYYGGSKSAGKTSEGSQARGKRKRHARKSGQGSGQNAGIKSGGASSPQGVSQTAAGGRPDGEAAPDARRSGPGSADNSARGGTSQGRSGAGQGPGAQGGRAPASRSSPPPRQSYAAIDLGTNNCRLLIARPAGDSFVVVDAFSRVVRLGEGLAQTGRLSDEAMDRALGALRVCAEKLKRRNVHLARSVATEACRRASNGNDFIERVRAETGIRLDIISAREEARLAVLGCHILLEPGPGPALVFDIGGGSTELVLVENAEDRDAPPTILDWVSVPWGVVSLTETCVPEREELGARVERYAEMRGRVDDSFAAFAERIAPWRDRASEGGPSGPCACWAPAAR
jgi:exopolyphosphatase/guanosine-5'-triphosphate,3'-diphosphate pyrophosphatase